MAVTLAPDRSRAAEPAVAVTFTRTAGPETSPGTVASTLTASTASLTWASATLAGDSRGTGSASGWV